MQLGLIFGGFFADNSKKGYTSEYARVYSRSEKIASALPDALWSPKSGMCQSINVSYAEENAAYLLLLSLLEVVVLHEFENHMLTGLREATRTSCPSSPQP